MAVKKKASPKKKSVAKKATTKRKVDAKKKELIGNFKNPGRTWFEKTQPDCGTGGNYPDPWHGEKDNTPVRSRRG